MSLGLVAKGQIAQKDQESSLRDSLDTCASTVEKWSEDLSSWSGKMLTFGNIRVLSLEAHPGIEPVHIHLMPNGEVLFKARTTPVGPGYHRHVVDLFEGFQNHASVNWGALEKADGTGFLSHKNTEKLEEAFTKWFQGLAKYILDHPSDNCVSMDLPHGIRVEAGNFIATTLGPRETGWLEAVDTNPAEHVFDFYPWWSYEKDASYHQGVALSLGWNLVPWRAPRTDREKKVMRSFIDACDRASSLDDQIELPRGGWKQCCQWLGEECPKSAEGDDPIGELGYRRGLIYYPLGAGWSVRLPGSFSQDLVREQGGWVAWDEQRRVEVRVLPLTKPAPVEEILVRIKEKSSGERLLARQEEIGFYGVGDLGVTEEGQTVLQAEYLCSDSILALQVIGPSDDNDWAKSVWESIRRNI